MGRLFLISARDETEQHMAQRWGEPLSRVGSAEGPARLLLDPSREEVQESLDGMRIVAFFGHATEDELGQPPLLDSSNVHQASGVIVAVACRSAARLGPSAVANGSAGYVGFTDDFPVIRSRAIDELIRDGFAALLAGDESPTAFQWRFRAACQQVQDRHFSISRDDAAFLIAQSAQVMKLTLQVLER